MSDKKQDELYKEIHSFNSQIKEHDTDLKNAESWIENYKTLDESEKQSKREMYEGIQVLKVQEEEQIKELLDKKAVLENELASIIARQNKDWEENKHTLKTAETEPVQTQSKGFFARIGSWFKNTFSSAPAAEISERDSEILILQEEVTAREAEKKKNLEEEQIAIKKLGGKIPEYDGIEIDDGEIVLSEVREAYICNGWNLRFASYGDEVIHDLPEDEATEAYENEVSRQLGLFFRELGNSNMNHLEEGFNRDVEVSIKQSPATVQSIMELLNNRDDEHIRKFAADLLYFSLEDLYREYPLHKMNGEERVNALGSLNHTFQELNSLAQFSGKFLLQAVSPNLRKLFIEKIDEVNRLHYMISNIGKLPFSYRDYYYETIEKLDNDKAHYKYIEEYFRIVHGQKSATLSASHKDVLLDVLSIEQAKAYDVQVSSFSVLTENGRARLMGNEDPDTVLAYAVEDTEYYQDIAKKIDLVTGYASRNTEFVPTLSVQDMLLIKNKVSALYTSLTNRLKNSGGGQNSVIRDDATLRIEDPLWYQRDLNAAKDKFEASGRVAHRQLQKLDLSFSDKLRDRIKKMGATEQLSKCYKKAKQLAKQKLPLSPEYEIALKLYPLFVAAINGPEELFEAQCKAVNPDMLDAEGLSYVVNNFEKRLMRLEPVDFNGDTLKKSGINPEYILPFLSGYKVSASGQPLREEDNENRALDTNLINLYCGDEAYRRSFIKETCENLFAESFDLAWLEKKNIGANIDKINDFIRRREHIEDMINAPENKEYKDSLGEQASIIHEYIANIAYTLKPAVAYYMSNHGVMTYDLDLYPEISQDSIGRICSPSDMSKYKKDAWLKSVQASMAEILEKKGNMTLNMPE